MKRLEFYSIFVNLFNPATFSVGSNRLYDASNLILPATTLGPWSYINMFVSCISLIDAPKVLPATQLELIDDYTQYDSMFYNCTSLVCGPELNIDVLPEYGYNYMFGDCERIHYIKMNTSDVSASNCLAGVLDTINYNGHVICNPSIADEIRTNYTDQQYYVNGVSTGDTSGGPE